MNAMAMVMPDAHVTRNAADEAPRNGDVVVTPAVGTPGRFTACQVPGSPSLRWDSRGRAVDVATRFALAHRVDAWFRDGETVERLHHHGSRDHRQH